MDSAILRKIHDIELEILDEVVRICESFDLRYCLIAGTLLGAIRHKGFIPWDDDLDIVMPREDYEKFMDLCSTELSPRFFLHSNRHDKDYWLLFAKIRKNNTVFLEDVYAKLETHHGIYIDIFPLDNAKKEDGIQKFQKYILRKIRMIIWTKKGLVKRSAIKTFISRLFSVKQLSSMQQRIMQWHKNNQSNYFVNLGSRYDPIKQTIAKDKYFPPVKVEFEGKQYNAPNDWDYFLRRIYGDDYMQLPPPEKRVTHNPIRIKFDVENNE